jgi:hypothetical protein
MKSTGSDLPENNDKKMENLDGGNSNLAADFINAIKQHRFWEREKKDKVPA